MNRNELGRRLRERIRLQGKSRETAKSYWSWVVRFLDFNKSQGVGSETKAERAVERFLTHLANREHVAANTQNQAFSAICYLYREVLDRPLENVSALRSKRPNRTRDVCSVQDMQEILARLSGLNLLGIRMLYGCGLRIGELVALRIKDLDVNRRQIHIWDAKGSKDRLVQFPEILRQAVALQIESVKSIWKNDVAGKLGGVSLPFAFGRKSPRSRLDLAWYWLFPSDHYSRDPDTGNLYRHHRDPSGFSKALKQSVIDAEIPKRITAHCIRHSFATHCLDDGMPIHVLKELMGHNDIATTETYLHVTEDGVTAARSPLESLEGLLANPVLRPVAEAVEPVRLRVFAG